RMRLLGGNQWSPVPHCEADDTNSTPRRGSALGGLLFLLTGLGPLDEGSLRGLLLFLALRPLHERPLRGLLFLLGLGTLHERSLRGLLIGLVSLHGRRGRTELGRGGGRRHHPL